MHDAILSAKQPIGRGNLGLSLFLPIIAIDSFAHSFLHQIATVLHDGSWEFEAET